MRSRYFYVSFMSSEYTGSFAIEFPDGKFSLLTVQKEIKKRASYYGVMISCIEISSTDFSEFEEFCKSEAVESAAIDEMIKIKKEDIQ